MSLGAALYGEMAQQPSRSVLGMIFRNFINSFKGLSKSRGELVAKDFIGNKYFEIPADPQGGKRKPTRCSIFLCSTLNF
jgi:hypothetical protein